MTFKLEDRVHDKVRNKYGVYKGQCMAETNYHHVLLDGRGQTIVIHLTDLEPVPKLKIA